MWTKERQKVMSNEISKIKVCRPANTPLTIESFSVQALYFVW